MKKICFGKNNELAVLGAAILLIGVFFATRVPVNENRYGISTGNVLYEKTDLSMEDFIPVDAITGLKPEIIHNENRTLYHIRWKNDGRNSMTIFVRDLNDKQIRYVELPEEYTEIILKTPELCTKDNIFGLTICSKDGFNFTAFRYAQFAFYLWSYDGRDSFNSILERMKDKGVLG